jgi:hypothetical protein
VNPLGLERGGDVVGVMVGPLVMSPSETSISNCASVCCMRRALAINSSLDSVGLTVKSGCWRKSSGGNW